ncbi:ABC transporter permease [Streptococcus sp. GMD1S]|nr:ABC transporter permease [Streptococcus sp. GMD1S]
MGYGLPVFLVYVLLLGAGKYLLFRQKASKFFTETGLDWDYVIAQESKRKQVLLRFFALFTQVKGVSNSVKPWLLYDRPNPFQRRGGWSWQPDRSRIPYHTWCRDYERYAARQDFQS